MHVQIVKLYHNDEYPGERTAVGFFMHGAGRDCCNNKQKRNLLLRAICPR